MTERLQKIDFKKVSLAGFYVFAVGMPFTLTVPQFGIAIAFLGWLGEGIVHGNWQIRGHLFFKVWAFYIAWNILASLLSLRPQHSLTEMVDNEWTMAMFVLMYWTIDRMKDLLRIVYVFLIASVPAVLYGIFQIVDGYEYYYGQPLQPMGSFFRCVGFHEFFLTFAGMTMILFIFSTSFAYEADGKRRWPFISFALASFLATIGTFARSMYVSFAAIIPLFGFMRNRRLGILFAVSLFFIALIGSIGIPTLRVRIASITDPTTAPDRVNLWNTSAIMIRERPLTGIGQDNFDLYFPLYRVPGFYGTTSHPHNDYLNVLVNSGFPGLFAFVAMWGIALRTGFRAFKKARDGATRALIQGATLSLAGFLVGSFFQDYYGTFYNCLEWWFLVGIIFTGWKLVGNNSSAGSSSAVTADA